MRYIVTIFVVLFSIKAQPQTYNFEKSNKLYPNPERGFYHHTEVHSGNYTLLNEATLKDYREKEGISLILRVFYLEKFRYSPISVEYLQNIQKDFNTIRKAGIKVIVRFAYTTKSSSAPYGDAEPYIVNKHLEQLKPLFFANDDIIAIFQAGFVGTWGEWYYTDHFSEGVGRVTEKDWEKRRALIDKYLSVTPSNKIIQVRTPEQRFEILQNNVPVKAQEALFYSTKSSRIGHHNDCFLASINDIGTYNNISIEKAFLEKDTEFQPIGGETCGVSKPYSDCDNAINEMKRFHWTYLNIDYQKEVLSNWKTQGCYKIIEEKLGYDIWLKSLKVNFDNATSSSIFITLELQNDGFSNPFSDRFIELALISKKTGKVFITKGNFNLRSLKLNESNFVNFVVSTDSNFELGEYEIGLRIPDKNNIIADKAEYNIRLRNDFELLNNYGIQKTKIVLDFQKIGNNNIDTIPKFKPIVKFTNSIPTNLIGKAIYSYSQNLLKLTWPSKQINKSDKILCEKSINGGEFEPLFFVESFANSYTDTEFIKGNQYKYKITNFSTDNTITNHFEASIPNKFEDTSSFPEIVIDAKSDDWLKIRHQETNHKSEEFRVFIDSQNFSFSLTSADKYQLFIDVDDNAITGGNFNSLKGIEYVIRNDSLYDTRDGSLAFIDKIKSKFLNNFYEAQVSSNLIANLSNRFFHKIYFLNKNNDTILLDYFKNIQSDLPKNIEVEKSVNFPESVIILNWSTCNNCDSLVLERSINGKDFVQIKVLNSSINIYRDDNLNNNSQYFYRIYTFNSESKSELSDVYTVKTGKTEIVLNNETSYEKNIVLFPNPSLGTVFITGDFLEIQVLNNNGIAQYFNIMDKKLDISDLQSGLYIIKIKTKSGVIHRKIVKL